MNLTWLDWSNPVSYWWISLSAASVVNITAWIWTRYYLRKQNASRMMILFSGGYVFGCAFRSFLPRADVQRICLFDTWFSSVLVGRSVATVAELCFVIQWAIALRITSELAHDSFAKKISTLIVPLIVVAECCSWFAVITTNYLGNCIEESLWGITYALITLSLLSLWPKLKGAFKLSVGIAAFGSFLYVLFMALVDVPMYYNRRLQDLATQKPHLGFLDGLHDLNTRWTVTHDIQLWRSEIPWMTLYFTFAVLVSIALCYVPTAKTSLHN